MVTFGDESESAGSHISPHDSSRSSSLFDSLHRFRNNVNVNRQPDSFPDTVAAKGNKSARFLRALVITMLLVMTIVVPILIYRNAKKNEDESFGSYFDGLAGKVISSFEFNMAHKLDAIDNLGIILTTYVSETNSQYPFVTMPDFDLIAANTLSLASAFGIYWAPVVSQVERREWESYSVENQGWTSDPEDRPSFSQSRRRTLESISSEIFELDDNLQTQSAASAPFYAPIWQNSPVSTEAVNFNLVTSSVMGSEWAAMLESRLAVLGTTFNLEGNDEVNVVFQDIESRPQANLFYPLFETFNSSNETEVIAGISISFFWHTSLQGLLQGDVRGLVAVIENSCNQTLSYEINGDDVTYLGIGDHHDRSYDSFARHVDINAAAASASRIDVLTDYCPYTLSIYPSRVVENASSTSRPALLTALVAIGFILCSSVALTYDYVVQQRLQKVLNSALESRAVISSLFPEKFRDRLFEKDKQTEEPEKVFGEPEPEATGAGAIQPAKMRLKSFIAETPKALLGDVAVLQSKPIADLYTQCTVLFADIAGFTAWSSEREPTQVFTLLQTIFHYFDQLARKWGVFKVETIGDCYVAVTGLPDPQDDHAVRMAKFAREALKTVIDLTHQLETSLGPDTGELRMRFGLHSGPVTAGVLRGDKSRFQLFGETVTMAQRMENTGKKDHVHVSQATADLITEAGKANWLVPRDDMISVKGKGQIPTYWVLVHKGEYSSQFLTTASTSSSMEGTKNSRRSTAIPVSIAGDLQDRKLKRLIDWQTEILARLIQQIIAQRGRKIAAKFVAEPATAIEKGECVLDEVAEILVLPKFEEKAKNVVDPKSIELSPAVLTQLREYVSIIATKYHDNPFHNFEHASHVTMSASKLLSRIVVPESVDYDRENRKDIAKDQHDYTYGITSDPLTQFAAIFCSLIHDVDHRGVSNFQLGIEQPNLAKHYKNRSLAEQNSVDIAWDLLMKPEFRNLQQSIFATESDLKRFRQLIVNLVLATDIFDKEFKTLRNSRWDRAFHEKSTSDEEEQFNLKSTIVIEHIIQAADVAHTMQHWHVYTKWNERLFREMYLAFEQGRMGKDPSEGWYKGELWFFDNYVIPLGKKLDECNVFGVASDEGLNYALQNRAEWASKGEQMVREMVDRYKESNPNPILDRT